MKKSSDNPTQQKLPLPAASKAASVAYRLRRRFATIAAIVVSLVFGYHVIFGENGLTAYQQKRSEDRTLQHQIQELQAENTRLQGHVEHLKNDPDAIEHEARERLHYTRPGEVIYTLNEPTAPATPAHK